MALAGCSLPLPLRVTVAYAHLHVPLQPTQGRERRVASCAREGKLACAHQTARWRRTFGSVWLKWPAFAPVVDNKKTKRINKNNGKAFAQNYIGG